MCLAVIMRFEILGVMPPNSPRMFDVCVGTTKKNQYTISSSAACHRQLTLYESTSHLATHYVLRLGRGLNIFRDQAWTIAIDTKLSMSSNL